MKTRHVVTHVLCLALAWAVPGLAQDHAPSPLTGSPGEPDRAAEVRDGCPTFSWGAFEGASEFRLAVFPVGSDHAKGRPVLDRRLPSALHSWTPSGKACLSPGRYAWAVRAQTADGWSAWSQPRLFEVGAQAATALDPEFQQAVVEVARWLREERPSPGESGAVQPGPAQGPASAGGAVTRPTPEPALFTPIPCQAGSGVFNDVPATHPFCAFIQQLFRDGITGGCATNPLRYCPDASVTRGQMAVFLERAVHFGIRRSRPAALTRAV